MGRWFPEQAYRFAKRLVAKIEELLKKKSKLLPGQLKYEERKADEHIALLQSERDLTQVIGKSQKEKYEVALVLDVDDGEIAIEVFNETSVMSNSKRWVPAVPYFCSLDNSSIQFTSGFWHQLPKVEQDSSSLQGDVGYRTGSMGTRMGGDSEDMEGLKGLMDGDADEDVDMIGSTLRRSLPSIHTDFSNGQAVTITIQGGNPITPVFGVTNYGHTPNQHHNTFPGLSTPNRTAACVNRWSIPSRAKYSPSSPKGIIVMTTSVRAVSLRLAGSMNVLKKEAISPTSPRPSGRPLNWPVNKKPMTSLL
ncbi:hypothetical protein FPQ18DRAFT_422251 [Pyronema domesticum]|nr:hypothetical protein FPQ18DRAFT_422251 [Pyronema domesticum]